MTSPEMEKNIDKEISTASKEKLEADISQTIAKFNEITVSDNPAYLNKILSSPPMVKFLSQVFLLTEMKLDVSAKDRKETEEFIRNFFEKVDYSKLGKAVSGLDVKNFVDLTLSVDAKQLFHAIMSKEPEKVKEIILSMDKDKLEKVLNSVDLYAFIEFFEPLHADDPEFKKKLIKRKYFRINDNMEIVYQELPDTKDETDSKITEDAKDTDSDSKITESVEETDSDIDEIF